jgi:hypothetical protein
MRFISNGDYIFPFSAHFYWLKQAFVWSYQTGSANPDGIIRMPGRLLDVLVFALFGNMGISYFFLLTCLAIIFLAFFYFSKHFLKITNVPIIVMASLFFTCNPIFLGNISKIGLLLAVAMLPLCLVMLQRAFDSKRLRYFLFWAVLLNISLIHPFTFTVNFLVSVAYLLYKAYQNWPFLYRNIPKLLLIGLVTLLLNAYFILPLASIGTVNKDVLSSSVDTTPTDYTSLIGIANTGDIFTGLSLSKGVLKDYEFYNNGYQKFYFLGIFTFYVILFGVFVWVEKRLSKTDKQYFVWSLAAFLVLILLAAVNFFHVKDLITLLVGLPGGWIFRSPLKWQLYVPFTVATMLAIVLSYISKKSHRRATYAVLIGSFILMNAFISLDVYAKLLSPRTISYFDILQQMNLERKNVLIVNDSSCFAFAASNPPVMTELNQVLMSKNVQVKQISSSDEGAINLSSYDYILGCQNTAAPSLQGYDFSLRHNFIDGAFQLYQNKKPKPYVYANQNVFALNKPQQVGDKYKLVTQTLGSDFDFIDTTVHPATATIGLQDAYDNMTFNDISGGTIKTSLAVPSGSGKQTLYIQDSNSFNLSLANQQLSVSPNTQKGRQSLTSKNDKSLDIPNWDTLNISYNDPKHDFKNILPNGSLEQGAWQKKVGDCYAFGGSAILGMSIISDDKTDGTQSLQLETKNHVACTGPNIISVQAGQNYLLSFDYKSLHGRYAAYYLLFDDLQGTSFVKRLDDTDGKWDTVTKSITAPSGAENLKILVYAYPDSSGFSTGTARYDNFHLAAIPDIQNHFYLVSKPEQNLQSPKKVSVKSVNPTRNVIRIEGVRTAFYLETKESYSPHWNLKLDSNNTKSWWPFSHETAVASQDHVKVNNFMNGWFVDPSELCQSGCTHNSDGSYTMTLVMEFTPQRWFYIGAALSATTFIATIGYFIYDRKHAPVNKDYVLKRGRL